MLCCEVLFVFLGDLRESECNKRLDLLVHVLQVALHAAFYVCAGLPIFYWTSTIEDSNSWGWIWVAGKWIATITNRNLVGSLVQGSLFLTEKESHFIHKVGKSTVCFTLGWQLYWRTLIDVVCTLNLIQVFWVLTGRVGHRICGSHVSVSGNTTFPL